MLRLYNGLLAPLRAVVGAWAALPRARGPQRTAWDERRARLARPAGRGGIWIHGASVGEARIATGLARELRAARASLQLVGSARTLTGRAELARGAAVDAAILAPLDFTSYVQRALDTLRPAVLTLVETELWPNLLHGCARAGIPVVVINGRLSERLMTRYRRLRGLYGPLLARLARVGAQSEQDASRFVELGLAPSAVVVTGNVKYDLAPATAAGQHVARGLCVDPGRPVLVAGSTREGEEALILDACAEVRRVHPDLLLILAPRHPARMEPVARLLQARGLRVARCSQPGATADGHDVVLVDVLGLLASLYELAWVAFVGGTLVPIGGHNLLEPALAGRPVVFGPHTAAVAAPAAALVEAGAGLRVTGAAGLARAVAELIENAPRRLAMGRAAAGVVAAHRGALERSAGLVLATLDARGPGHQALGPR